MHYIPALKDKTAELKSLTLLNKPTSIDLDLLWPLIEMQEPNSEDEIKKALDTIDASLAASPCKRFLLDLSAVDSEYPDFYIDTILSRYIPLEYLSLQSLGKWKLTPVLNIDSSDEVQAAAARAQKNHLAGVAIRLDFEDTDTDMFEQKLKSIVSNISLEPKDVHIILNAGTITEESIGKDKKAIIGTIAQLPYRDDWASITIIGAAYPSKSPEGGKAGSVVPIPRSDWNLFKQLRKSLHDVEFGDYGIENIQPVLPGKKPYAAGHIRYTTSENWLLIKGKSVSAGGHDYFSQVCQITANLEDFMGADFSWGDAYIMACATGNGGPGNPVIWRQIAITHHITFALQQIIQFGIGGSSTTRDF